MLERPHVLIIGDSTSMYFHTYVAAGLRDVADVTRVPDNGRTSTHILERFDAWVVAVQPDLVHLNCGLHDLGRHEARAWELKTPLDRYETNLRRIVARLQAETGARVIWASTTPVIDAWQLRTKNFARREADVVAYNAVAAAVMASHGIPINDLHALVTAAGPDKLLGPDGVHFTEPGSALLGEHVARVVRDALLAAARVGG
ncbi:MAG: SGNH/GDSL hydrolase family protein [Actinobacteria bacterium]|nr:SGNH/GDSL hydrolase family protein [Actinomycetota bacterium]